MSKYFQKHQYQLFGLGFPEEECNKICGTHWTMKVGMPEPGKIIGWICCDEMPEMNSLQTYCEGVEQEIDHPYFGGKAKV